LLLKVQCAQTYIVSIAESVVYERINIVDRTMSRSIIRNAGICRWVIIGRDDIIWKSTTKITPTFIPVIINLDSNKIGVRNLSTPFETNPVIGLLEKSHK
jgi:hypothetical protein